MLIAPTSTVVDAIIDFLATVPTADQIIAFKLPAELETRALDLLERSRQNMLSPEERDQMDEFIRMNHFVNMLKLKIRLKLAEKS